MLSNEADGKVMGPSSLASIILMLLLQSNMRELMKGHRGGGLYHCRQCKETPTPRSPLGVSGHIS
jgi:hypothetical protein